MGPRGLHLKIMKFIVLVHGTVKIKLAILAFLYCGEFVKNSNMNSTGTKCTGIN